MFLVRGRHVGCFSDNNIRKTVGNMSVHVRGPRLITDMAAEDFSLPNSVEKTSSRRTRGRGLTDRSKRPATRFSRTGGGGGGSGKERYMRTRSASFSGTVNDTRTCRLSIATTSAKRGEAPMLATMDKSGKILIDRQKSGQGEFTRGRRFRANSMVSVQRSRHFTASYVPGGTSSDPLNLQVEDLPETPQVPQPDPKRFDRPANNFIPTNQWDPLGLTNDDESVPVCLTYNLNTSKRKRVRARKKDPAAQAPADSMHAPQPNETTSDSKSGLPSATVSSVPDTQVDSTDHDLSKATAKTEPLPVSLHAKNDEKDHPEDVSMEKESDTKITESATSSAHTVQDTKSDVKPSITDTVMDTDTKPVGDSSVSDLKVSVGNSAKPSSSGVSHPTKPVHPREKNEPHPYRPGRIEPKVKNERERAAFEIFHSRTQNYPVMPSPIDVREKMEIPRDRKSLIEALKIEQMGEEEQERIIREQQKEQRDFRRQRFPNLKSPADDAGSATAAQSAMEPLKVDVDHSGKPVVTGQLSRTLDSIVSPKFQPHPGHIRKRRRTISDCSADSGASAAKALNFRRSSSPDVSHVSTPSPKKRRLSSGSGSGKYKKKGERTQGPPQVKFAKNPVFKYGNYYRYYGYRTPEMEPDYRLQYFRMDWFEGKDVLDIGCNSGHVTLAIAQLFHPQKIVGMDIDPNLIRVARQNIKSYQSLANQNETKKYPVSMSEYGPIEPLPALTNPSNYFPKNIMFMQGNYVLDRDEQLNYVKQEYDTILALSITKWIHLNTGDEGLKRAFSRMFQQLRPGGRLILEPQAWVSYRRRKKLTETIYKNYNSIKLKPEQFSDYLLNQVGFCKREVIGVPAHPSKGFQRQLLLFTKFSDQSSSPPNLVPPYPSGPRPVYSIAERMANLAGYSSTPSVDTPGVGTPTIQPPSFHLGESTPLNRSASYASSSSLCSTCMSRASTGPHESDSDYMGYPSNLPEGFPFESSSPDSSSQNNSVGLPGELGFGNDRSVGVLDVSMEGEGSLPPPFVNGQLEPSEPDDMFEQNWQNNFVQQNADAAADDNLSDQEQDVGGEDLQNGEVDLEEDGEGGWAGMPEEGQVENLDQPSPQLPLSNTPSWQDSPQPFAQNTSEQAAVCSPVQVVADTSQQLNPEDSNQAGGDSSEQAAGDKGETEQVAQGSGTAGGNSMSAAGDQDSCSKDEDS